MGTMILAGGPASASCFYGHVEEANVNRVFAIILRRDRRATPAPRGFWPRLRDVLSQISMASEKRPSPPPFERLPEGWNGATGIGPDRVLFSQERRMVRVAGQDYPLPETGTLVLMIEDSPADGSPGLVSQAVIEVPDTPRPVVDRTLPREKYLKAFMAAQRIDYRVWKGPLEAHPVIAAFMEPST